MSVYIKGEGHKEQSYSHVELVLLTDVGGPLFETQAEEKIRVGLTDSVIFASELRHKCFRMYLGGSKCT